MMKKMKLVLFLAALSMAVVMQSCDMKPGSDKSSTEKTPETTAEVSAKINVLADGDNAKSMRVDKMHMTRYLEIYLADKDPATGTLVAACYNTMFTPEGIPASKNTCEQSLVEGLDFEAMKAKYGILGASLNGPKLWQPDWTDIEEGVTREFNGIAATWCAQLTMDKDVNVNKTKPYDPQHIARKSSLGWNKGTQVLLLDDAEGNTWIMKGFQLGVHPTYTYEEFVAKGADNFKELPAGWKFRIKVLDKDYIETPETGVATIMADEFFNVYDLTGPGMGNYKP